MNYSEEHIQAIKRTITKYRQLTEEKIQEKLNELFQDGIEGVAEAVESLTGFGSCHRCEICASADKNCAVCLVALSEPIPTYRVCGDQKTWQAIDNAKTPEEAKRALDKRADWHERNLKEEGYL